MYILIKREMLVGIFSSKDLMRVVIDEIIKDEKEKKGMPCGDFHFRYIKMTINEPWFTKDGKVCKSDANAILSLSTMHTEKFTNKVETDWSTGEIIKL